jgi:hypothetical protein
VRVAALLVAVAVVAGCGSSRNGREGSTSIPAGDTAAIEKHVDQQVDARVLKSLPDEETTVASKTTCAKRPNAVYRCVTHFSSPPGQPDLVTAVSCGGSGRSCVTEPKS